MINYNVSIMSNVSNMYKMSSDMNVIKAVKELKMSHSKHLIMVLFMCRFNPGLIPYYLQINLGLIPDYFWIILDKFSKIFSSP